MAVAGPRYRGWKFDPTNSRLDFYYNGTRIGHINATTMALTGILTVAGASTLTGNVAAAGTLTSTGLLTASAAATVTTGNLTTSGGDERVTAGNVRLGVVSTFGTTEPTSAIVFKVGTAPVGAITTSGGIFTDGTVMRKIIAAGTASNIQS